VEFTAEFLEKKINAKHHWWGGNSQHYTVGTMISKIGGKEKFKTYTSFSIVRNPYDRLISIWKRFSKIRKNNSTLEQFVNKHLGKGGGDIATHLKHQYKYVCVNEKICVDKIFRTENFNEITDFLKDKGFTHDTVKLTSNNIHVIYDKNGNTKNSNGVKRDKENFMDYYTSDSLLKKVNEYYKKDFELFDYKIIESVQSVEPDHSD